MLSEGGPHTGRVAARDGWPGAIQIKLKLLRYARHRPRARVFDAPFPIVHPVWPLFAPSLRPHVKYHTFVPPATVFALAISQLVLLFPDFLPAQRPRHFVTASSLSTPPCVFSFVGAVSTGHASSRLYSGFRDTPSCRSPTAIYVIALSHCVKRTQLYLQRARVNTLALRLHLAHRYHLTRPDKQFSACHHLAPTLRRHHFRSLRRTIPNFSSSPSIQTAAKAVPRQSRTEPQSLSRRADSAICDRRQWASGALQVESIHTASRTPSLP